MSHDIPKISLTNTPDAQSEVPLIKLPVQKSEESLVVDFEKKDVKETSVDESSYTQNVDGPFVEDLTKVHWTSFDSLVNGANVYTGERDDQFRPHGYGTQQYSNGDIYVGKFSNGVKAGRGSYSYADGSDYFGEWDNGKRNGFGTMRYSDSSRYKGDWDNDQRHGWGKYEFANGDIYEGLFERGRMHGYCGIYSFAKPNYLYYVGPFKKNKMHWKDCVRIGQGKLYASKGVAVVDRMVYADIHHYYSAQTAVESFLDALGDDDEDFIKFDEYVTEVENVLRSSHNQ